MRITVDTNCECDECVNKDTPCISIDTQDFGVQIHICLECIKKYGRILEAIKD